MLKLKIIPIVTLSLALMGCSSIENNGNNILEERLLQEMSSYENIELSHGKEKLLEVTENLIELDEKIDFESTPEYLKFLENLEKIKKMSQIELISTDKQSQTAKVVIKYINIGELTTSSLKDHVERAFVSSYQGEFISTEFYSPLFDSINKKIESGIKLNSFVWTEKEVTVGLDGEFNPEDHSDILTLGFARETEELLKHFEKLFIEKEFLNIQENFKDITKLYDESFPKKENERSLEKKLNIKFSESKKDLTSNVYYLEKKGNELTLYTNHNGEIVSYKK